MMDKLEHLQSVQAVLQLMSKHGLCCGECDAEHENKSLDRFFAEFLLFLKQKGENANELQDKCCALVTWLPKVPLTFLDIVMAEKRGPGAKRVKPSSSWEPFESILHVPSTITDPVFETETHPSNDIRKLGTLPGSNGRREKDLGTSKTESSDTSNGHLFKYTAIEPLVGLSAMQRASTTLEDFCRSYFMFHGMNPQNPRHLFKYLPVLYFVEAVIYQFDEKNEEIVQCHPVPTIAFDADKINYSSSVEKSLFDELKVVLAEQGLLTDRLASEFKLGMEYWQLEQKLCLSSINEVSIAAEDVLRAIKLKSFDYRILNLLLYALTGEEVNEAHFTFLAVSEYLVEISDDLFDYEDDVLKNSFNILRMLVKVYGAAEAPGIMAKIISNAETEYHQLLDALEPNLADKYRGRCKEATQEGGSTSKYEFGSWVIPPVIVDENKFRTSLHP